MAKSKFKSSSSSDIQLSSSRPKSKMIPSVTALNSGQKTALREMANPDNHIIFLSGIAGCGKAQPLRSLVLTPLGFKRMGDIVVGDIVSTPDGSTANVIGVFPQGEKDIYRIHFNDGDYADCCEDHLWKVSSTRNLNQKWQNIVVDTKFILENFDRYGRHLSIPITNTVYFESKEVLIDPYIMGILIGDGCLTHAVSFSTADEEVLTSVTERIPEGYVARHRSQYDYSLVKEKRGGNSDIIDAIRYYCLDGLHSHEKFIPKDYLHNSEDIRMELLRGLMDSDGYINKNSGQPCFSTSSEDLAKDFEWLIKSLGGTCKLKPKKTTYTYLGEKYSGKISFRGTVKINRTDIFKLSRKLQNCLPRTKYKAKRIIDHIEKLGKEEAQCIMLDSAEKLYITDNFIVTHNTFLAASWGLEQLLKGKFERMIITRPYVESGEKLGYLPGTFEEKTAPFMIPIQQTFEEHMSHADISDLTKEHRIIVLPLAYMRGVSFKKAFVLLDEAQNTTISQMHLFLTRIGENSKMVVTGDPFQSDLGYKVNGFNDARERLTGLAGISLVDLDETSVRHPIINGIDARYKQKQKE